MGPRLFPVGQVHDEKIERELWLLVQGVPMLGLNVVLDSGLWESVERDEMRVRTRRPGAGIQLDHLEVRADNSGGACRFGAQYHLGTMSRSVAPNFGAWAANFQPPMPPSRRCSTLLQHFRLSIWTHLLAGSRTCARDPAFAGQRLSAERQIPCVPRPGIETEFRGDVGSWLRV